MAIQYKLSKDDYDALPDAMKSEYKVGKEGMYFADIVGIDLSGAAKYDDERSKRRAAEKAKRDAESALEDMRDNDDRPAMVEAHKRELGKVTKERDDLRTTYNGYVRSKELDTAAMALAEKLNSKMAKVLLPHVKARLELDMTDAAAPKVVVLGADGKPGAQTLDDLHKEFVANKDYADIVVVSPATGGAASRPGGTAPRGNPAAVGNPFQQPGQAQPLLRDMSPSDLKARIEARGGPMRREQAPQQ